METGMYTEKMKFQITESLKAYLWYEDADKETTLKAMAKAMGMGDDVYAANVYFNIFRRYGTDFWIRETDGWLERAHG